MTNASKWFLAGAFLLMLSGSVHAQYYETYHLSTPVVTSYPTYSGYSVGVTTYRAVVPAAPSYVVPATSIAPVVVPAPVTVYRPVVVARPVVPLPVPVLAPRFPFGPPRLLRW